MAGWNEGKGLINLPSSRGTGTEAKLTGGGLAC